VGPAASSMRHAVQHRGIGLALHAVQPSNLLLFIVLFIVLFIWGA